VRHYSRWPGRICLNVEVERGPRRIELRGQRVRVELDPQTLELALRAPEGGPRLCGARPRVWVAGRAVFSGRARSVDSERVDTPLGTAVRVLACAESAGGLQLGLSLDVGADWPGLVLQLAVQNSGGARVSLDALDTLGWRDEDGELELPGPASALRWLDPGAHGGVPARSHALRRGLRASCAASLGAPGLAGLTLGFLGWRVHAGRIELEARGGVPLALAVRSELSRALEPGERLLGERVWIGFDRAGDDGLAIWAEQVARELELRRRRPISVWCTGPGASAERTLALARALHERELPVDGIRIDAGFAERAGDWLRPSRGFPLGLAPVARELRALGLALGVRLAPFAASSRAELARAHPDWLLPRSARSSSGRVRVLDAGREPVLAWLESLGRGLRERDVAHLWLDELWLGLPPSGRPERAAVYRRALEALRRGAGPDAYLTGLGAPFAASAGLLDALELDRGSHALGARWLGRSRSDPTLRAGLAGRLANAQSGAVALDARDAGALRDAAVLCASLGGNVSLSGFWERVSPARWRLARRMLPSTALAPRRQPRTRGVLIADAPDGSRLLALLGSASPGTELLGDGALHVFDAWHARDLGMHPGSSPLALDAGASQLLRLVPVDGEARLVGTTLHLCAGAAELRALHSDASGSVQLELALPGPRQGSLHVRAPGSDTPPIRTRVAFRDTLELEIGAGLIRS
jgi:hypothetical protein